MADTPFSDWVRERPPEVQRLMIDWPPEATVKAKPGETLLVPAPGVEGRVASWFESGNIGVEAPLATNVFAPAAGEVLTEGETLRGECDPTKLELVHYAEMADGTVLDSALIRSIVET